VTLLKYRSFHKISEANFYFVQKFHKISSLDSLYQDLDRYATSSAARVFRSAYLEMKNLAETPHLTSSQGNKTLLHGVDNLERSLSRAIEIEVNSMESRLTILATTGSTGPFIGLFGTVWGIMDAFHKIGVSGSASLAVVAPGISEALVATAIGLAAAIPAVVAYNNLIARVKKEEHVLQNFGVDFLNMAKRHFFLG
jgi:biopolymer transport protein TolQ